MHENLINQLNFYIKQKETTASTFVGRMVGSALHQEIDTLRSAVQAIEALTEHFNTAEDYKKASEERTRLVLEEFRQKLMDVFIEEAGGNDFAEFTLEEIGDTINDVHGKFEKETFFSMEETGNE